VLIQIPGNCAEFAAQTTADRPKRPNVYHSNKRRNRSALDRYCATFIEDEGFDGVPHNTTPPGCGTLKKQSQT
jgi:hypothetical protein